MTCSVLGTRRECQSRSSAVQIWPSQGVYSEKVSRQPQMLELCSLILTKLIDFVVKRYHTSLQCWNCAVQF